MEHIAALIANLSHSSATLSIVCLTVSSGIRSAKRRASLARCCQYSGSLTSGATGMERVLSRTVSGLKVASMTTAHQGRHLLGLRGKEPGRKETTPDGDLSFLSIAHHS